MLARKPTIHYNINMEITLAQKEDSKGILTLQSQIYRISSLPQNARHLLEKLLKADYCDLVVAKENGKVIGSAFIFYMPIPAHGKPFAYLEGMVVDKDYRGKGIGSAMLKKIIDLTRQKNCYKIIFTSGFNREDSHKFYEKLGFKKWGWEFRMDL